jgi:hypothetical protein
MLTGLVHLPWQRTEGCREDARGEEGEAGGRAARALGRRRPRDRGARGTRARAARVDQARQRGLRGGGPRWAERPRNIQGEGVRHGAGRRGPRPRKRPTVDQGIRSER